MNNKVETKFKQNSRQPSKGAELNGIVVGIAMVHTVKVKVVHLYRHPLYRKAVRKFKYFLAHNESLPLAVGDAVRIAETKPISKRKHFIVINKTA